MKVWIRPAIAPIENRTYVKDKKTCSYWLFDEVADILQEVNEDGKVRVLMSAGLWAGGKMRNFRFDRRNRPVVILADSAGFQYYGFDDTQRRGFYEEREKYYSWQAKEGDYVLAGDIPPKKSVLDSSKISQLIEITRKNIEFQFALDDNMHARFVNIIHGVGVEDMKRWYNVMSQFPGRGWAIGAKFNDVLLGAVLQYLFLLEANAFNKNDIVHLFAMTGKTILLPMLWLIKRTRPDLIVSVDSSSYSLIRVGQVYDEDGSKVTFDDIRKGKAKVKMYDGTMLDDKTLTRKTNDVIGKQIEITGLKNFMVSMKKDVNLFIEDESKFEKMIVDSKIKKYYKQWKTGGEEMVWYLNRKNVIESGVRLR